MKIVEYPHPALLAATIPVRQVDKALRLQVGQMFELMYEAGGIGLAANQVALPYRFVIMNIDTEKHDPKKEDIFINPVIVSQKGSIEDEEGCLSFPGLYAKVRRAKEVTVEAYDLQGESIRINATGLAARAWQHEIDHLDGKVFVDRFSTISKLAHRNDIKEFERRFRLAQKEGRLPADADIEKTLSNLRQIAEG
jgi:peptide deformylase